MKMSVSNKWYYLSPLILLLVPLIRYLFYDGLAVGSGSYDFDTTLYSYVAASFNGFLILPFIFGFLSLLLCVYLLPRSKAPFVILLMSLSPALLWVFSVSNSYSLLIFLVLLSLAFHTKYDLVSLIVLIPIAFYSLFDAIFVFLAYLIYHSLFYKTKTMTYGLGFLSLLSIVYTLFVSGWYVSMFQSQMSLITLLFSDLGSIIGFSLFLMFISLVGIVVNWKKLRYFVLLAMIMLAVGLTLNYYYFAPTTFIMCYFGCLGYEHLQKRSWQLRNLKAISLFLIILGIIFSGVSYIDRLSESDPIPLQLESLNTIPADSVILTHDSYTGFVTYFASQSYAIDVFYERTIDEAMELLRFYEITHIWITPEMKSGLVWQRDDEGLLFLLQNSENFKKLHEDKGYEVWEVV